MRKFFEDGLKGADGRARARLTILAFESALVFFFASHLAMVEAVERTMAAGRAEAARRALARTGEGHRESAFGAARLRLERVDAGKARREATPVLVARAERTLVAALAARGERREGSADGGTEATTESALPQPEPVLRNGFPKGSPLAPYLPVFEAAARKYGHDPRLMPAIAIVESSGGIHCAHFNPFGRLRRGAGSGLIHFASWEDAIWNEAAYIHEHWGPTKDPRRMRGYCPNPAWAVKVRSAMRRF